MVYNRFQVRVSGKGYGEYTAEAEDSSDGMLGRSSGFPTPDPLQITALRSKLAAKPSAAAIQALGTLLFETLFTGGVLYTLRSAIYRAQLDNAALRIQLAIEPNELSALPWELLFDPKKEQFLALSNDTTLVRYVTGALSRPVIATASPLRILALFPNPNHMPSVDIVREQHVMQEALLPLISSRDVELIILEHATVQNMFEALIYRQVHILYYQGHVGFNPDSKDSYFLLEDPEGRSFWKGMDELSYTLHSHDVRLAVINSCGMAAGTLAFDLVGRGIPAVVATQEPLQDIETAIFLKEFSQALANGWPVDAAVSKGRRAMFIRSGPQARWASPILVVSQPDIALLSMGERP